MAQPNLLRITLAPCSEPERPVGCVYVMADAPLYPVCEMLAAKLLTVVMVEECSVDDESILRDALTGAMTLRPVAL